MNINEQFTTTVYLIIAFWSHRIRPFGSSNPHMVPMLEFKVGSRSWAFEEGAFDESWWITYESLWSNRFLRMGAGWEKREIYENIPVRIGRRWRSPWRTRHPKLAAAVKVWDPDRVAGGQQLSYQLLVVKYKRACMSFLYGCSFCDSCFFQSANNPPFYSFLNMSHDW